MDETKTDKLIQRLGSALTTSSEKFTHRKAGGADQLAYKDLVVTRIENELTVTYRGRDLTITRNHQNHLWEAFNGALFDKAGVKDDFDLLINEIDRLTADW